MNSPYVTYNNEIGVRLSYLIADKDRQHPQSLELFSYSAYEKKALRQKSFRLRTGLGAGREVLIRWSALEQYHTLLIEKFGNPKVDHNPMEEFFTLDGKARLWFETYTNEEDKTFLKPEQISQYTLNASVLNTLDALYKARRAQHIALGNGPKGVWELCASDCTMFNEVLKLKYNGVQHTLPKNERRLRDAVKGYQKESYSYLLDRRGKNKAAAKIKTELHLALIEQLLRKHNNFDNEQITSLYNIAAKQMGWKEITSHTVANYRKQLGLYVYSDSHGANKFRNTKAMQVVRTAPTVSMAYWTLDGWDVELLYQKVETDGKGHQKTTYHNRLTVVVVMDPVAKIKYPIGYAIGTHETPELIAEAMRNAANHTRELFGARYKPLQIQSDHYALKTLTPLYEAMSKRLTPARVGNAKAKVIEPYFLHLNKMCQTFFPNWSGFGVTSQKESQPNQEYLNKIRHSFPDEQGVRDQITKLMEMERSQKVEQYMQYWNLLPEEDRYPLTTGEYLYLFGETHTHTNRIQAKGFAPTLMGQEIVFDVFDPRFRELSYVDWAVKYDPEDLSQILVLNAECDSSTRKLKEIIGTQRFELQTKYVQPMALYDRKEGDGAEKAKIEAFNTSLEQSIIDRRTRNTEILERAFLEHPQLNDTLTKMVLTDSHGQHKDQRNKERALPKSKPQPFNLPAPPVEEYEIIPDDVRTQYGSTNY